MSIGPAYFGSAPDFGGHISDFYANSKLLGIYFTHIPSKQNVGFKAYITNFQDSYGSEYAEEKVFGRSDPIYTYKNTTRTISLGFQVVAGSDLEAAVNLSRVEELVKFTYPMYNETTTQATAIAKPPMVKIRFANLIINSESDHHRVSDGGGVDVEAQNFGGLPGFIKSLSVTPNFEDAGIVDGPGNAAMYPKLIDIAIEFAPIHTHTLGWVQHPRVGDEGVWIGEETTSGEGSLASGFPYGIRNTDALHINNQFAPANLQAIGSMFFEAGTKAIGLLDDGLAIAAENEVFAEAMDILGISPIASAGGAILEGGVSFIGSGIDRIGGALGLGDDDE